MNSRPDWLKKNNYVLIFSILTFLVYIVLFKTRHLDDNRLTSWQWIFDGTDAARIFLILIPGVVGAYILSGISFFARRPVLTLFSLSYVVAALFWKEPEVILDASRYFTQAKYLEVYGVNYFLREWGKDIFAWTDMPAVPFFYGLIFKFFGEARSYIQIFTTSLFSMTVVLTYLTGREIWDKEIGFFGGMLVLGMPYLFTQVPLILVDVPSMFFLILSVFTFIKSMKQGGLWMALSPAAIFFAFYSKYSMWLMLSIIPVVFFVYAVTDSKTRSIVFRGALVAAVSLLLTGAFFLWKSGIFSEQIKLLNDYQRPGLYRWSESFVSTFFFQIHPFITAAALFSAYEAFRKRDWKYLIICWLVFLVLLLGIRRIRYIMVVFPMLGLMASYGLARIGNKEAVRFISWCIVISSVVIAVFAYLPFLQKVSMTNIKDAGKFLDSIEKKNIEVFTPLPSNPAADPAISVPILDFFTKKRICYKHNLDYIPPQYETIKKSSLRFTWEYKIPAYYSHTEKEKGVDSAVVVIYSEPDKKFPSYIREGIKGYSMSRDFNIAENVFDFKTFITVYY